MGIDRDAERYGLETEHSWEENEGVPSLQPSSSSIDAFDDNLQDQAPFGVQVLEGHVDDTPMSPFQAATRRLRRDRRAMISLVLVAVIIVLSFMGPIIYLHIGPTVLGGPILQDHIGP